MQSNFKNIRESEARYHTHLYNQEAVFTGNSWLARPIEKVLSYFDVLLQEKPENLQILDLGCGVGRHAIPILEQAKSKNINAHCTCIDILESALFHLKKNLAERNLTKNASCIQSDIENFIINTDFFDYILSISCIEHASSRASFEEILENIKNGTRKGGINAFFINCDVVWKEQQSGKEIEPQIELNFSKEELQEIFSKAYKDWNILETSSKKWLSSQEYLGKKIDFESTCFFFFSQK